MRQALGKACEGMKTWAEARNGRNWQMGYGIVKNYRISLARKLCAKTICAKNAKPLHENFARKAVSLCAKDLRERTKQEKHNYCANNKTL
jgi:hypothetical protein